PSVRGGNPPHPRGRIGRRALQSTGVAAAAPGPIAASLSVLRFFDSNEGELRRLRKFAARVNAVEETTKSLSEDDLRRRTELFRERLAKDETIDDLLPEAFAAVREAARRTLEQRHFDVQLLGGMALHK